VLEGQVVAAAGKGRDTDMIYIAELLSQGRLPAPAELSPDTKWAQLS